MSIKTSIIFLLCFLSLTLALSPTVQKKIFTVGPGNRISYDLYQTRNGIISHNIEKRIANQYSQYTLIDLPSQDAKPILTDLVRDCLVSDPNFKSLHYHVATDSLVFFCNANNSLLIIDQSDYATIQATIPLNLNETWPNVRLSTDGMNIAVLLIGDLFTKTPQSSSLIRVSLQTRQVITQITFNEGLSNGEAVVAFASNKNAAYVATNKLHDWNINTTVYLLYTIGNTYQVTPVASFDYEVGLLYPKYYVTELFCVGNFITVTTNNQELIFIDQKAAITTVSNVNAKTIFLEGTSFYQLAVTTQYDRNDIYLQTSNGDVLKYTVLANIIKSQKIGNFCDMQIVYGNQTSGDLLFALEANTLQFVAATGFFNVIDLQTLQPISRVVVSSSLMITNATYATFLNEGPGQSYLYIYDLKNDTRIAKMDPSQDYYYNQEQQIISFFAYSPSRFCALTHIDLSTAKIWTTLTGSNTDKLCTGGSIINLRMTEQGKPQFILSNSSRDSTSGHHSYVIYTESTGFIDFSESWISKASPLININWDLLTFTYFNPNGVDKTNLTRYSFDSASKQFKATKSSLLQDIAFVNRSLIANESTTLVLIDDALTVITDLGDLQPPQTQTYHYYSWELLTSFKDHAANQYFIASTWTYRRHAPRLFAPPSGFIPLPGVSDLTYQAQATGANSFMIVDTFTTGVSLVRCYDAGSTGEKTTISRRFRVSI